MSAKNYATFQAAFDEANKAGYAAATASTPVPMVVQQHASALDDASPVKQEWFVSDGVCGFAWVKVSPGTSSFAKWLVKNNLGHAAYGGGVQVSIHGHNQSMQRKEKHASVMAAILAAKLGVSAYADSRMD